MESECPDVEILAAYVDRCLEPDEQKMLEAHLVDCYPCRKTIELTFKSEGTASDLTSTDRDLPLL